MMKYSENNNEADRHFKNAKAAVRAHCLFRGKECILEVKVHRLKGKGTESIDAKMWRTWFFVDGLLHQKEINYYFDRAVAVGLNVSKRFVNEWIEKGLELKYILVAEGNDDYVRFDPKSTR